MGGGAGKTIRRRLAASDSPWGVITKGYKTRNKKQVFEPLYRGAPRWPADETSKVSMIYGTFD